MQDDIVESHNDWVGMIWQGAPQISPPVRVKFHTRWEKIELKIIDAVCTVLQIPLLNIQHVRAPCLHRFRCSRLQERDNFRRRKRHDVLRVLAVVTDHVKPDGLVGGRGPHQLIFALPHAHAVVSLGDVSRDGLTSRLVRRRRLPIGWFPRIRTRCCIPNTENHQRQNRWG